MRQWARRLTETSSTSQVTIHNAEIITEIEKWSDASSTLVADSPDNIDSEVKYHEYE